MALPESGGDRKASGFSAWRVTTPPQCPPLRWDFAMTEIVLPEMHRLGGEKEFAAYQEIFSRLYHSGPIIDVLGRTVIFPNSACRHVCFVRDHKDRTNKNRVLWDQERAEHIGWIYVALTDPTEVRWNHQNPKNQAYLLGFPSNNPRPMRRYYVSVEPKESQKVLFLTAYPILQKYWDDARNTQGGKCGRIYCRPIPRV
jgi:hypothetical protein